MVRFFTLEQAQGLLPEVRRHLESALSSRREMAEAEQEMAASIRRVRTMGGVQPDREKTVALRQRRNASARQLKDSLDAVHELGVQVKDLDTGLVDFPTLYGGEEVLICYRLGETGLGFWHGIEEGFRGRKRIDRDFLDHHSGDETE